MNSLIKEVERIRAKLVLIQTYKVVNIPDVAMMWNSLPESNVLTRSYGLHKEMLDRDIDIDNESTN